MTPHSVLYNETLLRLHRTKRATGNFLYNGSHDSINKMRYINDEGRAALQGVNQMQQRTATLSPLTPHKDHDKKDGSVIAAVDIDGVKAAHHEHQEQQHNKINTEKHWRYVKNKIRQKIKFIDSHNQPPPILASHSAATTMTMQQHADRPADCHRLNSYAWLFIFIYVLFALSLFSFLVLSESTVFTVTIMTSALPLIGIFWSFFELKTSESTGKWNSL